MDIQSSVSAARRGDADAHADLVAHYVPKFRRKAEAVASASVYRLDPATLESEYVTTLQRCLAKYDEQRGPFENLLNRSLRTQTLNVQVRAAKEYERARIVSLDSLRVSETGEDIAEEHVVDVTADVEAMVLADIAAAEILEEIRGQSLMLEKVVLFLVAGYSADEVAQQCGVTKGSKASRELWTMTQVRRVRRILRKEAM